MRLLGKDNNLWVENHITKEGYVVLAIASLFGFICFLAGRKILKYRKTK